MTHEHTDYLEQQARLKVTYRILYDHLVAILYVADLARISHVARDEYEPEVTTILLRLPEATGEADVERIMREEFARWFYPDPGITQVVPERYAWAARQIWQVWCTTIKPEQSPCRQCLTALWWAVKLRFFAIMMPVRKPGRVFWV